MQRVRRTSFLSRSGERGYILLTLIFFVAVIAITAATVLPSIIHEIQRDREEEMIHRGVQYSRAIRAYYKKTGRYPTKIDDLESTNNLRFLRRRYKDPITGEDFKLLHYGDPGVRLQVGGIGPVQPGVGSSGQIQPLPGQPGLGQPGLGQTLPGGAGALTRGPGILQQTGGGVNPTPQQNPGDPNQNPDNTPAVDANGNPVVSGNNGQNGGDSDQAAKNADSSDKPTSGPGGPSFGGGAIVGVVSRSRNETIREFNKKHHYNEWQFIYDPGADRGGLINTPAQPQTIGSSGPGQENQGQPGTPGQTGAQPSPNGGPNPNPPPGGDPQE